MVYCTTVFGWVAMKLSLFITTMCIIIVVLLILLMFYCLFRYVSIAYVLMLQCPIFAWGGVIFTLYKTGLGWVGMN